MPETPWYERKIKKIVTRDWEELVGEWQSHLPVIETAGEPPSQLICDIAQLEIELDKVPTNNLKEISMPIVGVREAVLHDGIFLLHKAAHVLGSAQVHIREGMCTWSISSAYHAAFFAAHAIMHFLGVTVVEYDNKWFLLDVWASPWKKKNKKRGGVEMLLQNMGHRPEQRHKWIFFQRLLEITANAENVWVNVQVQKLIQYDFSDFARHRNNLHYRSNLWPGADLHECVQNVEFGKRDEGARGDECLDNNAEDFCVFLAIVLFRMSYKMFAQIAETSKDMQAELRLLENWLNQDRNGLYRQAVQEEQLPAL